MKRHVLFCVGLWQLFSVSGLACTSAESPQLAGSEAAATPASIAAVIELTGSSAFGSAPLKVNFDGTRSSSNPPASWIVGYSWDFGDGSMPVTGGWVTHTYTGPGVYTAVLAVTDNVGRTARRTQRIQVDAPLGPQPVIAAQGYLPFTESPTAPFFDGTASTGGDPNTWITGYRWDFGDGPSISFKGWGTAHYSLPGIYHAYLTVTDNRGRSNTAALVTQYSCPTPDGCGQPRLSTRWARQLGTSHLDYPISMESDKDGDIFLLSNDQSDPVDGMILGPTLAKYTSYGAHLWSTRLKLRPTFGDPSSVTVNAMAVAPDGSAWVVGDFTGELQIRGLPDYRNAYFLLRYSPSGEVLQIFGVTRRPTGVAIDSKGFIYLFGYNWVSKRGPDAQPVWGAGDGQYRSFPRWVISSWAVRPTGEMMAAGYTLADDGSTLRPLLARIGSDGTLQWDKFAGVQARGESLGVAVGPDGAFAAQVLLTSGPTLTWGDAPLPQDGVVVVGNADGAENWMLPTPATLPGLAYDERGNLAIGGHGISLFDSAGSPLNSRVMDGGVEVRRLKFHPKGLAAAGGFIGQVDLGAGPFAERGLSDAFLIDVVR